MLVRALGRSLQSPALRAVSASSRLASTQWTRNLASNNRRPPPKRPTDYLKPAGGSSIPKPAANPAASGTQYSKQQDEIDPNASSDRNVVHPSERGASEASNTNTKPSSDPAYSPSQAELDTSASPSENTAPQSSASTATGPHSSRPLPDLTQGIPSTLEYETMGSTSSERPEMPPLNLTEDPSVSGGGGRGRGELPASAYISSAEKKRLRVANYMYGGFVLSCVIGYIYLGRHWETEEEERSHVDAPSGWSLTAMWNRAQARVGNQLNYYKEPAFRKLLPDQNLNDPNTRPYTLVLSLEDLLVHSEWSREHGWRLAKRPGIDYFIRYLSQYYEIVLFTSVPFATAEPVLKKLDPYHLVQWPLFREATNYKNGEYVKDLSYLNRDLSKVILIDTVEGHARDQPGNAIILPKWTGDAKDRELVALVPFLEYVAVMGTSDIRPAIKSFEGKHIPAEFAAREAIARKRFEAQMAQERSKRPKVGLGSLAGALGLKPTPMFEGEERAADGFAQGKMLQDQARERGRLNYEYLEKQIRDHGEEWLREEAEAEERMKQEATKAMKSGLTGFFGPPKGEQSA